MVLDDRNSTHDARLARAAGSLEGLSVGDAFGERFSRFFRKLHWQSVFSVTKWTDTNRFLGWRKKSMKPLVFLGIIALWVVLQIWVLPRFGVST
jgi:hypothetical protein